MIKRKELTYDNSYLLKVFNRDFPHLVTMAEESSGRLYAHSFLPGLKSIEVAVIWGMPWRSVFYF